MCLQVATTALYQSVLHLKMELVMGSVVTFHSHVLLDLIVRDFPTDCCLDLGDELVLASLECGFAHGCNRRQLVRL